MQGILHFHNLKVLQALLVTVDLSRVPPSYSNYKIHECMLLLDSKSQNLKHHQMFPIVLMPPIVLITAHAD